MGRSVRGAIKDYGGVYGLICIRFEENINSVWVGTQQIARHLENPWVELIKGEIDAEVH